MSDNRTSLPPAEQDRLRAQRLDLDTIEYGHDGPFLPHEGDHTALAHVLWHAKHEGFTLADNADEVASLIGRSRWLRARIANDAKPVVHFDGSLPARVRLADAQSVACGAQSNSSLTATAQHGLVTCGTCRRILARRG